MDLFYNLEVVDGNPFKSPNGKLVVWGSNRRLRFYLELYQTTAQHSAANTECWVVKGSQQMQLKIGVPLSNNPFHKGIPGIQTTTPNHQFTLSGSKTSQKKKPLRLLVLFQPTSHQNHENRQKVAAQNALPEVRSNFNEQSSTGRWLQKIWIKHLSWEGNVFKNAVKPTPVGNPYNTDEKNSAGGRVGRNRGTTYDTRKP